MAGTMAKLYAASGAEFPNLTCLVCRGFPQPSELAGAADCSNGGPGTVGGSLFGRILGHVAAKLAHHVRSLVLEGVFYLAAEIVTNRTGSQGSRPHHLLQRIAIRRRWPRRGSPMLRSDGGRFL